MSRYGYGMPPSVSERIAAQRLMAQQNEDLARARRKLAVARAAGDLYVAIKRGARAGREVTWVGTLGPLTEAEREKARRFVSDMITYEVSSPGYSPAERALIALNQRTRRL